MLGFSFFRKKLLEVNQEDLLLYLIKGFMIDHGIYPDNRGYLDLDKHLDNLSEYLSLRLNRNLTLILHGPWISLIEYNRKHPTEVSLGKVLITTVNIWINPLLVENHRKKYDSDQTLSYDRTKIIPLSSGSFNLNDPKSLLKINIQV